MSQDYRIPTRTGQRPRYSPGMPFDPTMLSAELETKTFGPVGGSTWRELVDDNAIKTSAATPTVDTTYSGGSLNGVIGAAAIGAEWWGQDVLVTTSSSSGTYRTGASFPIVITGTDLNGNVQAASVQLTAANGGEALRSNKIWKTIVSVLVPGQVDANGAIKIGLADVGFNPCCRRIRGGAAGNISVKYQSGNADLLPCLEGELHDCMAALVSGAAATTAFPIKVGL